MVSLYCMSGLVLKEMIDDYVKNLVIDRSLFFF